MARLGFSKQQKGPIIGPQTRDHDGICPNANDLSMLTSEDSHILFDSFKISMKMAISYNQSVRYPIYFLKSNTTIARPCPSWTSSAVLSSSLPTSLSKYITCQSAQVKFHSCLIPKLQKIRLLDLRSCFPCVFIAGTRFRYAQGRENNSKD
jgi:hypothetical protein